MDIYNEILKELNKGNAVLMELDVDSIMNGSYVRYRLVTPDYCEYANQFVGEGKRIVMMEDFRQSCFIKIDLALTPKDIMQLMKDFDYKWRIRPVHFEVI